MADVVIVGGGYLGLWTAWQLQQLEPGLDVVLLEAGICGHGPSGRNGGFVSTLWDDLPILRDRVGDRRAVEVCRASERAVSAIGSWCADNSVDAWYRAAGTIQVATSESAAVSGRGVRRLAGRGVPTSCKCERLAGLRPPIASFRVRRRWRRGWWP